MAVPKRRTSKRKKRARNTHKKAPAIAIQKCPRCQAKDQYGDNCEVCGATYDPTELKNPYSTLSGAKPIEKHRFHHVPASNTSVGHLILENT